MKVINLIEILYLTFEVKHVTFKIQNLTTCDHMAKDISLKNKNAFSLFKMKETKRLSRK